MEAIAEHESSFAEAHRNALVRNGSKIGIRAGAAYTVTGTAEPAAQITTAGATDGAMDTHNYT